MMGVSLLVGLFGTLEYSRVKVLFLNIAQVIPETNFGSLTDTEVCHFRLRSLGHWNIVE